MKEAVASEAKVIRTQNAFYGLCRRMCVTVNPAQDNMSGSSQQVIQSGMSLAELTHLIFWFDFSSASFTLTLSSLYVFFAAAPAGTPPAGKQHRAAGRASSDWLVISGLARP